MLSRQDYQLSQNNLGTQLRFPVFQEKLPIEIPKDWQLTVSQVFANATTVKQQNGQQPIQCRWQINAQERG